MRTRVLRGCCPGLLHESLSCGRVVARACDVCAPLWHQGSRKQGEDPGHENGMPRQPEPKAMSVNLQVCRRSEDEQRCPIARRAQHGHGQTWERKQGLRLLLTIFKCARLVSSRSQQEAMAATTTFVSMRQQHIALVHTPNDDIPSCGKRLAPAAARQNALASRIIRDIVPADIKDEALRSTNLAGAD